MFDSIIVEFKESLEKAQFKEKDSKNFKAKKKETKFVVEVKPLQIKYNNLKQQWRKITDKKKPALDYPSLKILNGSKSSINDDDVEQETPPDKTRLKTKIVTKPNEKRNIPHSQLPALSQLAAGVNKLAELNAKRMKLEEREALLKFRREKTAKNGDHGKEMAKLYLRTMTQQVIPHNIFHLQYSVPHTPERFNFTNSFTAQPF